MQVGQGEGLIKEKSKTYQFFFLAHHNIFIHTVIKRSKLAINKLHNLRYILYTHSTYQSTVQLGPMYVMIGKARAINISSI